MHRRTALRFFEVVISQVFQGLHATVEPCRCRGDVNCLKRHAESPEHIQYWKIQRVKNIERNNAGSD